MAPEHLGELGGLPVADGAGHDLDRQSSGRKQLRGAVHPGALELAAEACVADLREGALELPPAGGDLVGDHGQREIGFAVAASDHLESLAVEVAPPLCRGCPHTSAYVHVRHLDHKLHGGHMPLAMS